jgi:hypothetical protein
VNIYLRIAAADALPYLGSSRSAAAVVFLAESIESVARQPLN